MNRLSPQQILLWRIEQEYDQYVYENDTPADSGRYLAGRKLRFGDPYQIRAIHWIVQAEKLIGQPRPCDWCDGTGEADGEPGECDKCGRECTHCTDERETCSECGGEGTRPWRRDDVYKLTHKAIDQHLADREKKGNYIHEYLGA